MADANTCRVKCPGCKELNSLEMIHTLQDITRDFVLGKIETIIKRSRPDFPQEASFREGPFDPHKVLTAVGMSTYQGDSVEKLFSFVSILVWNRFEQYPQ